jgi:hypothetical protein
MLYLPGKLYIIYSYIYIYIYIINRNILALWFHQVMQSGDEGVIAINYWYDMDYSNTLYPTMALYRRLITGVMEGNRDLLKEDDDSE